jgi:hypothetical protein
MKYAEWNTIWYSPDGLAVATGIEALCSRTISVFNHTDALGPRLLTVDQQPKIR